MLNSNNSNNKPKSKAETKQQQEVSIPGYTSLWFKEKECLKQAIITDQDSKRKTDQTFPRTIPMNELIYNLWLEKIRNPKTGEFFMQRNSDESPLKGTGSKLRNKNNN